MVNLFIRFYAIVMSCPYIVTRSSVMEGLARFHMIPSVLRYLINICITILLLCSSSSFAAEEFSVSVKSNSVQLGKPIWLTIFTSHTRHSLNKVDFSKLGKVFEVVKDKNAIQQTSKGQAWRIRLYPRDKGHYTIPELSFHSFKSKAIKIRVTQSIDDKSGMPFDVAFQVSNPKPWLRQQVLMHFEINSTMEKLILIPQQTEMADSLFIPLSTETIKQGDSYLHKTGWALFSRQPGERSIKLPELHYVRDGVITHRFYPPTVKLDVKPLPTYLPGNIPVGRLELKFVDIPTWLLKGRLTNLYVQIQGESVPEPWLVDLRHTFASTEQFITYPAERKSIQINRGKVRSSHTWHIPIKTMQQGLLQFPQFRLHYFDPDTGRLVRLDLALPGILSLSFWSVAILTGIAVIIAVWLSRSLMNWWRPHWFCFKTYHSIFKDLPSVQSSQDFRRVIAQLCEAEGWSNNLSLRQWQARLPEHLSSYTNNINQQLEPALYYGKSCNTEMVCDELRGLCQKRWAILQWV